MKTQALELYGDAMRHRSELIIKLELAEKRITQLEQAVKLAQAHFRMRFSGTLDELETLPTPYDKALATGKEGEK